MKIGILIDRLNVGGVEKIAIEQVRALRAAGEDAILVVLRKKAVVDNVFPDLLDGIPISYLDERLNPMLKFSFGVPGFHFFSIFHITYPLFLPYVVKKNEFDYIIAHGTYTSLSAVAFKRKNRINFSSFIWDPASYIIGRVYKGRFVAPILYVIKKMAIKLDAYLIKNMSRVLVGGQSHNDFIRSLSLDKKIEIIYPSVHPLNQQSKKEGYVLMVTAWKDGKHPEYILTLAERIPSMQVKMAGKWVDDSYKQYFDNLVYEKGLQDQIEVIGSVSEQELGNLYARAQVLLQTNDDRGFGMPALEAASAGTTFIIPEGQGVCELFVHKKHGFYTKEQDTDTIVSILNKLLSDDKLAYSMGDSAMTRVKKYYSWSRHAQSLIKIINEDIGKGF